MAPNHGGGEDCQQLAELLCLACTQDWQSTQLLCPLPLLSASHIPFLLQRPPRGLAPWWSCTAARRAPLPPYPLAAPAVGRVCSTSGHPAEGILQDTQPHPSLKQQVGFFQKIIFLLGGCVAFSVPPWNLPCLLSFPTEVRQEAPAARLGILGKYWWC